jgi:hypothetical protein
MALNHQGATRRNGISLSSPGKDNKGPLLTSKGKFQLHESYPQGAIRASRFFASGHPAPREGAGLKFLRSLPPMDNSNRLTNTLYEEGKM